ncbi:hypothetical protein ACF0H5_007664 [Mactra antiquata]
MASFVFVILAVTLFSTDVNCGKNDPVYQEDFENEYRVIERMVFLEEAGIHTDDDFKYMGLQINNLTSMLKDANETVKLLNDKIAAVKGKGFRGSSTFTRWGHTECGGDAEEVYSGYMAGSYFSHAGSGSNYICATSKIKYGAVDGRAEVQGLAYGIEYRLGDANEYHDAPCVVCRIPRNSAIMIPGTNECEEGWTTEYRGRLASQAYNQHSKDYICLDERPQWLDNGKGSQGGGYLYKVAGRCGPLQCPPYKDYYYLTCVVCSFGTRDL